MKYQSWGIISLLILFLLASCSTQAALITSLPISLNNDIVFISDQKTSNINKSYASQSPTPQPDVTGTTGFPIDINPLTGLNVDNPEILNRRPVLTKISNFPPVGRPHAGLSYADIVFEYYIGEWTNRFLALFYSNDVKEAWPLRSGRLVDSQLTNMYHGILAYGNADSRVDTILVNDLGNRAISFNEAPCPAICGEATHTATGVYVNTAELSNYATSIGVDNVRQNLNGMLFSETPPTSNEYAVWIAIQYIRWNRGEWFYDPESHKYLRWIESWDYDDEYPMIPLVDKLNGEQIAFSNIIILFANYIEYAPTLHDIEILNNTKGERAVIFRDGIAVDGYWVSNGQDHPIRFLDKWGLPVPLKPGNSWIVIVGNTSTLEKPGDGQWRLLFDVP